MAGCGFDDGNGCVGFWLIGAGGDQFPAYKAARYAVDRDGYWWHPYPESSQVPAHQDSSLDVGEAGPALLTLLGERLGTEAVRVSETIDTGQPNDAVSLLTLTDSVTVKQKV